MTARARPLSATGDDPDEVWDELGTRSAILEAFVPFEREISVIAARSADGEVECFDVTENEHRDHILKISRAPAAISDALAAQARGIAEKIANALNYVGVLAVEMFVVERRRAARSWSTRSRRGCIIPDTGRSTAPRSRNSSSTSAPSPAGRSASRSGMARYHDQPDRGRYQGLRALADRSRRDRPPLRQGRCRAQAAKWAM